MNNYSVDLNKYRNSLNIEGFSSMLSSPATCYKFYWLEALVKMISENVTETTLNDLIDEMIANAWYTVTEFHIHLSGTIEGEYRDGLERTVNHLNEISDLNSNDDKDKIKRAIKEHKKELQENKEQLIGEVPYRALSGFYSVVEDTPPWRNPGRLVEFINKVNEKTILPYVFSNTEAKLDRRVFINPTWRRVIQDNTVQILGWIQNEKAKWLQRINPEVPSIVNKLQPSDAMKRKLNNARDLWRAIITSNSEAKMDIYSDGFLESKGFAIDHFIPWSFVMNDELWNLTPTTQSANSSKSNYLPKWEDYFVPFAQKQFLMYNEINNSEEIHKLFEKCYSDNIHSIWAEKELYTCGNSREKFYKILEENMKPVYDSARRQGYQLWKK